MCKSLTTVTISNQASSTKIIISFISLKSDQLFIYAVYALFIGSITVTFFLQFCIYNMTNLGDFAVRELIMFLFSFLRSGQYPPPFPVHPQFILFLRKPTALLRATSIINSLTHSPQKCQARGQQLESVWSAIHN